MLKYLKKHRHLQLEPVEMFMTSRNRNNNSKDFKDSHGSLFGGILSILFLIATMTYLVSETNQMMLGSYDNFNIQSRPNSFQNGYDSINLANSSFYPWFRFVINKSLKQD